MNTILQSTKVFQSFKEQAYDDTKTKSKSIARSNFWTQLEESRFGMVPMILLFVVCIGSVCGATVLMESSIKLAIVVISTSMVQAMIIAVLPVRIIVLSAIISIVLNIIVTLI